MSGLQKLGSWVEEKAPIAADPLDLYGERSRKKTRDAKKRQDEANQSRYDETMKLNPRLDAADDRYYQDFERESGDYLTRAQGLTDRYTGQIDKLRTQASDQANRADMTYTNSILPGYKDAMGKAKTNADQAMTLAEAGDPNNKIMKAVRDLYNKEGQAARAQGQQDFGILSALGAQAAQGQVGAAGDPMTAGQMGQIYGANQAQAGDAYARAQQRMYDLQTQGLDRGFDQSNRMYEYGQDAQRRYSDTIKDLQGGEVTHAGLLGGLRGEQAGYSGDIYGAEGTMARDRFGMGMMGSGILRDVDYSKTGRTQAAIDAKYGYAGESALADQKAIQAERDRLLQMIMGGGELAAKAYGGGAG